MNVTRNRQPCVTLLRRSVTAEARRRVCGSIAIKFNQVEHPERVRGESNEGLCRDTCLACFKCGRRSGVPDLLNGRRLH
jgi:hypothetical protein